MRRFTLSLLAVFALGVGLAIGAPSPASAYDPDPDCFVKCKNGFESVCCPRRLPSCIQTEPPTPCDW